MWLPFDKTISNIKIVFVNARKRDPGLQFFTLNDILFGKTTTSASLTKTHFPKIAEQAPLKKAEEIYTVVDDLHM